MVRTNPTWGGLFSDRLLLNRRIVNLLNTGKLYVNQVKNSVKKSATQIGCTREQSEEVFSEQQEKAPGYRIVAALRNHFQHRSLAILSISYPSSIEIKTEAEREDEGIVRLTHHKLRQPQDIVSKTTSEYSMGWLGPSATS